METAVSGKWSISPAGPSPTPAPTPPVNSTGTIYNEERTGIITTHSFAESVNWNPTARLYFETTFNYVLSQTNTPANQINLTPLTTPTLTNFRNDFWTITSSAGYILDEKTDLHAEYTFYRAADYLNNSGVAMPYGAGQTEHTVSASVTRQISKNMRLLFRYTYYTYEDQTSGNHNNYEAHSFYSGLQYRF
jgi:predicted porin